MIKKKNSKQYKNMDIMQKATICSAVCTEAKNLVKRAYFLEEWNMGSEPVRLQFLPLSDLNTGNREHACKRL